MAGRQAGRQAACLPACEAADVADIYYIVLENVNKKYGNIAEQPNNLLYRYLALATNQSKWKVS